jgi:hypothetical protein
MKFRMIFLGAEQDPDGGTVPELDADIPVDESSLRCYEYSGTHMVRRDQLANGRVRRTPVANFRARIVSDIIRDDGAQQQREFGVEAELGGSRQVFALPAAEFGRMGWVLERLGPRAIIYPGQQQHVRAAMQSLSGAIHQEHIYAHLGWRRHGSQWVYLHAGGALGVGGPVNGLQVQPPAALQHYQLRVPANHGQLTTAVRASLQILLAAPDRISFPLLASVYRAALGASRFSLFLSGPSGVFKTAFAALAQQHFGAAMDASGLPANFASTANALERLAYAAKDALLVVDDFAPAGGVGDGLLESVTERLFRGVGNAQARSRLGGDGRLQTQQAPRGLVLGTGEAVPPGQSIRARLLIVEMDAGAVRRTALNAGQSAGREGLLAAAMGAFVVWLAGTYEAMQNRLQQRVQVLRSQGHGMAGHARTPAAMAELRAGWEIFLDFAEEKGAIGGLERAELEERAKQALVELAGRQAKYQTAGDPAVRFTGLLKAALATGQAYVADRQGKAPTEAAGWGWQRTGSGHGWKPRGRCIGWVVNGDLYLEPSASYQVVQEIAGTESLAVSEAALRRRLWEQGLLASRDTARQVLLVRRILAGAARKVLHLRASHVLARSA